MFSVCCPTVHDRYRSVVRDPKPVSLTNLFADDTPTLTIFYSILFNRIHRGVEPSRVPYITCFSVISFLSLVGATGLSIRATSGGGFCEEFLSDHPEKCREAGLAIVMSWTSFIIGELMYLS
jgi:hypothetical protein